MPKYRYAVNHRVSLKSWIKFIARDFIIRSITTSQVVTNESVKPVFIVGCGHSGTTLLANRLGLHPDIYTFPFESRLYLPCYRRVSAATWFSLAFKILSDNNKKILIEKTPKHVHVLKDIIADHPKSLILGLVRNPLDNIASLNSRFRDLNYSTERWLIDNSALLKGAVNCHLTLLKYEELVQKYSHTLQRLFELMCLKPIDHLYIEESAKKLNLIPQTENQKIRYKEVSRGIENKIGQSATRLTAEEKSRILRKTLSLATDLGYSTEFLETL